jgi:hypothetical protein
MARKNSFLARSDNRRRRRGALVDREAAQRSLRLAQALAKVERQVIASTE